MSTTCTEGFLNEEYRVVLEGDAGRHIIPAGGLTSANLEGQCSSTLAVKKITAGKIDSLFIGGAIQGYPIRRTTF